ncbi:endonuclease III [Bacillus sonorensis]|nr:endonuclease III [Bacillus sonorensis]
MLTKKQIEFCLETIGDMFPDAECELVHDNPFELVIAVALSAQCTDALVNKVTKTLFQKYKKPEDYLAVPLEELQQDIKSIGLYRNKAKNIQKLCKMLIEEYGGEVPRDRDELVKLPGVGRKTANVVVSVAFGVLSDCRRHSCRKGVEKARLLPLERFSYRSRKNADEKIPESEWSATHHRLIFFGRYHCKAQRPKCEECPLFSLCREGQKRYKKGLVKLP